MEKIDKLSQLEKMFNLRKKAEYMHDIKVLESEKSTKREKEEAKFNIGKILVKSLQNNEIIRGNMSHDEVKLIIDSCQSQLKSDFNGFIVSLAKVCNNAICRFAVSDVLDKIDDFAKANNLKNIMELLKPINSESNINDKRRALMQAVHLLYTVVEKSTLSKFNEDEIPEGLKHDLSDLEQAHILIIKRLEEGSTDNYSSAYQYMCEFVKKSEEVYKNDYTKSKTKPKRNTLGGKLKEKLSLPKTRIIAGILAVVVAGSGLAAILGSCENKNKSDNKPSVSDDKDTNGRNTDDKNSVVIEEEPQETTPIIKIPDEEQEETQVIPEKEEQEVITPVNQVPTNTISNNEQQTTPVVENPTNTVTENKTEETVPVIETPIISDQNNNVNIQEEFEKKVVEKAKQIYPSISKISSEYTENDIIELAKWLNNCTTSLSNTIADSIIRDIIFGAASPAVNNILVEGGNFEVYTLNLSDLYCYEENGINTIKQMEYLLNQAITDSKNLSLYAAESYKYQLGIMLGNDLGLNDTSKKILWTRYALGINLLAGTLGPDFKVEYNGETYEQSEIDDASILEAYVTEAKQMN